jgi:hypothetical protein
VTLPRPNVLKRVPMSGKIKAILHPRSALRRLLVRRFGDYEAQIKSGVIARPSYAFCLYNAAKLAHRLGYQRISAIEFGVAGGNGLLSLEQHAEEIGKLIPIEIEIYGFDTAEGLPPPVDYRDLLYHWKAGFYKMDLPALQAKLRRAKLVLGEVSQTLSTFFEKYNPAPIGAISFDLDFYSSTKSALAIFRGERKYLLPRVFCYFDDTIGREVELYSDFTGQRLAINEFNLENDAIKLGFPYCLLNGEIRDPWRYQIWVAHLFKHPDYNTFISDTEQQLPIESAAG